MVAANFGRTRAERKNTTMVKSASASTARLTRDDGGGHTGRRKGAGSVTEDSSRAAWLQQARSCLRDADPVGYEAQPIFLNGFHSAFTLSLPRLGWRP